MQRNGTPFEDRRRVGGACSRAEVARRSAARRPGADGRWSPLRRCEIGALPRHDLSMTLGIQCVCIDTTDPSRLASFWQSALGWRRTQEEDDEVLLEPPEGSPQDGVAPDLLFLRVPEEKSVKNRLHIDLRPSDQAAEVARLESLGARRAHVGQGADVSWVVMADPDGNEFCVLRALGGHGLSPLHGAAPRERDHP